MYLSARVSRTETDMMLSIGNNRKLAKHVAVFNLPRMVTCPGATDLCKQVCYDKKSLRYKAAQAMRGRNLLASHQNDFVGLLEAEIRASRCLLVRLHESGDVYNQVYLDKIMQICTNLPQVTFLIYTKSHDLDWSKRPNNLKVYWSIDKTTPKPPPPGPTAYLLDKGAAIPVGKQTCVHAADQHYCGSECTICWAGTQDVYFPQH